MNNFEEKENNVPGKKDNEAKTKKTWQAPEIIDLDVELGTEGKTLAAVESQSGLTSVGPAS